MDVEWKDSKAYMAVASRVDSNAYITPVFGGKTYVGFSFVNPHLVLNSIGFA